MSENAIFPNTIPVPDGRVATRPALEKAAVVHNYFAAPRARATATAWAGAEATGTLNVSENMTIAEETIRQQLARILQSSLFVQSEKLSRFLRFIVEHAVAGNQKHLKEYLIGCEVYDRKPPYNPSVDSIVRTEARRLRSKLRDYYEAEGKNDALYIHLRPGSYSPVFQSRAAVVALQNSAEVQKPLIFAKPADVVAIFPFADLSGSTLSSKYARGIAEELAFMLLCAHGCRVISPVLATHSPAQEQGAAAAMRRVGANVAVEGSVREENNHIRVIARILDGAGFHLWATRFDVDAGAHTIFALEEQIVAALSAGYGSLFAESALCG